MQGTSLTKQERECKLYDEFDKFTYKKGETLPEYYLRFTLLLNDMNIYKMPLEQFKMDDPIDAIISHDVILNVLSHPAKIALMDNLSRNGSDALTRVHNPVQSEL
ncbi:hypothetical protein Tco_0603984 [Tanacetum coccineum]